jgi:hypothetical protein
MKKLILLFALLVFTAMNAQAQCTSGDCQDGYGTYKYSDGSVYVGQFKDGKANGYGTCYYANGDKYVGYWKNHKAEGEGSMYNADGTVTTGNWKESKYVDTKLTTGCISGDCLNGNGTYVYDDGTKYTGTFKDGSISGSGECSFYNGDYYNGE